MANINIDRLCKNETAEMTFPHSHPYYEIYFLIKGTRVYFVDDISFKIEPNHVVVIPPEIKHMTGGDDFERILVKIFPNILTPYQKEVLDLLTSRKTHCLSSIAINTINECFNQMFDVQLNDAHPEDALMAIFSYIIYLLKRDILTYTKTAVSTKKLPTFLFRIIEYINSNYNNKISLESVAQHFNYSVSNIRKIFLKYIGVNLGEYILQKRLLEAKKLLATTEYTAEEISAMCGFSYPHYFSYIFKKKEKMSPLAYRNFIIH